MKRFIPILLILSSCGLTTPKPKEPEPAGPDTCQRQLAICAINVAVQKSVVEALKEQCAEQKQSSGKSKAK